MEKIKIKMNTKLIQQVMLKKDIRMKTVKFVEVQGQGILLTRGDFIQSK